MLRGKEEKKGSAQDLALFHESAFDSFFENQAEMELWKGSDV